jgi:hypothetical protein
MMSELLHCERCGKEKWIRFSDFGRYPDFLESSPYEKDIEKFAGRCSCGGQFRVRAAARCPRCKSTDWKEDPTGPIINYD